MDVAYLVQARNSVKVVILVAQTLMRRPLLHFLVLGGLLLFGDRWLAPWLETPQTITVTPSTVESLRASWAAVMKRPPSPQELDASLQHWVDDEILLREALRLQLEQTDNVARNRLLMNLRFVDPETRLDDEALLREARTLGMTTRDHVVRRRLIDLMEQRLASGVQISDTQTRDYVAQHADRYAQPPRYDVRQLYFNRDLRHQRTRQDALACHQRLLANAEADCTADPFLLGDRLKGQTKDTLARSLGLATADDILQMKPHQWSAPVESLYGWHLFRIESVESAGAPDYEQVRRRATYALLADREKQVVAEALLTLRKRYVVALPDVAEIRSP